MSRELAQKILGAMHIEKRVPTIIVHQPPAKEQDRQIPLPIPTLDNFNPIIGAQKFIETYQPMFGDFTMRAYQQVLSEKRSLPKHPERQKKEKKKLDQNYFETTQGKKLQRRLDRNFYTNLAPNINHGGSQIKRTAELRSLPFALEELSNKFAPGIIKKLAKYLPPESIGILNRKLRFAPESPFDPVKLEGAQYHYLNLLREANTLVPRIIGNLLEGHGDMLRNRNETTASSSLPSDLLLRATLDKVYFERTLFEAQVQGALVLLTANLYADSRNLSLNDNLSAMQKELGKKFFDGKIGEAVTHTTYALYDNKTNQVIGIAGRFMPINFPQMAPEDYHWKEHKQQVRKIRGQENVYALWDVDIKDWDSVLEKLLFRTIKRQKKDGSKSFNIQSLTDMHRMRIVVEGTTFPDDPLVKDIADQFKKTLRENPDVEDVRDRKTPLTNQDKVDDLINYVRMYVKYKNIPKEIEVIFYDEATYLTSQYHIGNEKMTKENINNQLGRAHSLYKKFREMLLISLLMPSEVPGYNHGTIDILQSAINSYNAERGKLSAEGRVDEEKGAELYEENIKYEKVDLISGIVEVKTSEGIFIPLLYNNDDHTFEFVNGEVPTDIEGQIESQRLWEEQETKIFTLSNILDHVDIETVVAGDEVTHLLGSLQRNAHNISGAVTNRKRLWPREKIPRVAEKELGISAEPDSILYLPSSKRNRTYRERNPIRGRRKFSEIEVTPCVIQISQDSLPTFTPNKEHQELIWVQAPDWDRNVAAGRRTYLSIAEYSKNLTLPLVSTNLERGIYRLAAPEDKTPDNAIDLPLSKAAGITLSEYLESSFLTPKPV